MVGAEIYVRVSTKEQTENLSLPTQPRACEEYCRRQGYEILERFHQEGESAKTPDRSQLQALLKYGRTHKGKATAGNATSCAKWNQLDRWLRQVDRLRRAA